MSGKISILIPMVIYKKLEKIQKEESKGSVDEVAEEMLKKGIRKRAGEL